MSFKCFPGGFLKGPVIRKSPSRIMQKIPWEKGHD
jgi:hypothetical protein